MNDKIVHCVQTTRTNVEELPRLKPLPALSKRPQRLAISSSSSPSSLLLSCSTRRLLRNTRLTNKKEMKSNQVNDKCLHYSKEYTQLHFDNTTQNSKTDNNIENAPTNTFNTNTNEKYMKTNNYKDTQQQICNSRNTNECKCDNPNYTEKVNPIVNNEMSNSENEELLLWLYASKGQETSVKQEREREKSTPSEQEELEQECRTPYNRQTELFDIKENHSSGVNSRLMLPHIFDATSSSILYNRSVMQELENTLKRSTQHETRILRAAKQAVQKEREEEMELLHKQNKQSTCGEEATQQASQENVIQETLSLLAQLENRCNKPREQTEVVRAKVAEVSYNYGKSKNSNCECNANICNSKSLNDNESHSVIEIVDVVPAFANLRVEPLTVDNLRRRYGEYDVMYAMQHKTKMAMTTLSIPSTASLLQKQLETHLPHCSVKSNVNANKDKLRNKLLSETSATHTRNITSNYNCDKTINWQRQAESCDDTKMPSPFTQVECALTKKLNKQQQSKKSNASCRDKVVINSKLQEIRAKNNINCNMNSISNKNTNVEKNELVNDKKLWWTTEKFRFHLIRQWCDRTQLQSQFYHSCKHECSTETQGQIDAAQKEVEEFDPEKAAEVTMHRVLAEELEAKTNCMLEQRRALRKYNVRSAVQKDMEIEENSTQSVLHPSERNSQLCAKPTPRIELTESTTINTEPNSESAIDLTSVKICNTASDAWWAREFEPWKDVNMYNVHSSDTLHHHHNHHKELQQEKQEQEKSNASKKEWYLSYLSCCERQLLEMLTNFYYSTFDEVNSEEEQYQQKQHLQFGACVNSNNSAKLKTKKEHDHQNSHELTLILTFASTLCDYHKTTLNVDLSELLHLTPTFLLDKWCSNKERNTKTDAGGGVDDNEDREEVTLRAAIDEWRCNLHSVCCRTLESVNSSCDSPEKVSCSVEGDREVQTNQIHYLCSVAFDITSFVNASLHCIAKVERHSLQLVEESETNNKFKCITASLSLLSAEQETESKETIIEKGTLEQPPLFVPEEIIEETPKTNNGDSVIARDDTLLTLPHAPLYGRRRYPIDMRQLYVTASLCKEENENTLFDELRKLKTEMQLTRTQLINFCKYSEGECVSNIKDVDTNQMSTEMCEHNEEELQRIKQQWNLICKLQNAELEYVEVMHKACENELLIIKYNSQVKAYNCFAQQEQPLWGKLYKIGLLISYALCLYLHRHGMDELPEKYFVLLPQVARFLNCVGGYREMRLRLPQLLIEINERAKNVRLHLDYVMQCWAKNSHGCACNEEKECVILDAVVRAAAEVSDDHCTKHEENNTNTNDNSAKQNENHMDLDVKSNGSTACKSANTISRFISCLATEEDVVATCMRPLPMPSVRLKDVLHEWLEWENEIIVEFPELEF